MILAFLYSNQSLPSNNFVLISLLEKIVLLKEFRDFRLYFSCYLFLVFFVCVLNEMVWNLWMVCFHLCFIVLKFLNAYASYLYHREL